MTRHSIVHVFMQCVYGWYGSPGAGCATAATAASAVTGPGRDMPRIEAIWGTPQPNNHTTGNTLYLNLLLLCYIDSLNQALGQLHTSHTLLGCSTRCAKWLLATLRICRCVGPFADALSHIIVWLWCD